MKRRVKVSENKLKTMIKKIIKEEVGDVAQKPSDLIAAAAHDLDEYKASTVLQRLASILDQHKADHIADALSDIVDIYNSSAEHKPDNVYKFEVGDSVIVHFAKGSSGNIIKYNGRNCYEVNGFKYADLDNSVEREGVVEDASFDGTTKYYYVKLSKPIVIKNIADGDGKTKNDYARMPEKLLS